MHSDDSAETAALRLSEAEENGNKKAEIEIREMEVDDIPAVFHLGEKVFTAEKTQRFTVPGMNLKLSPCSIQTSSTALWLTWKGKLLALPLVT